jgi:hypothetical protein
MFLPMLAMQWIVRTGRNYQRVRRVEVGWGKVYVPAYVGYAVDSENSVLHVMRIVVTHPCCSEPV